MNAVLSVSCFGEHLKFFFLKIPSYLRFQEILFLAVQNFIILSQHFEEDGT